MLASWKVRDSGSGPSLSSCTLTTHDAIINENYDYLKGFLEDLAPPERSSLIQDWETSGLVYLDYIRVIEMLHHIQQVPEILKLLSDFPFLRPLNL
nr:nuclear pore complex protein Nup98-Nup96-like [Macaca nemestrina]